jgi:crotonobetainyl-CoA:carnitine CoA-transferase CaiB-like acyl-CoA transferase
MTMREESKRGGPLEGVRVIELTKVWAGPETGKQFAYLGAEVIKIESMGSLDVTRVLGPYDDIDKAPGFKSVNPEKLSVQIDVKSKEGIQLIRDLIADADIFVENLRPGAIDRMGLGYEAAKAINPGIVFISMGMYGNDGPLAYQTGYAPCFNAIGGLSALVGYEGETPTGINVRYADSTYGTAAAFAGLVALLHKRRTGIGQFVDVSAVETMTSMVADAMMDYTLNGVIRACDGNRHPEIAPHSVYRCQGNDWISIATPTEAQWQALAGAVGLAGDPCFATLADRKTNEAALDEALSGFTAGRDAVELVAELQALGIAAGKSQNSVDLVADASLWGRGLYTDIEEFDGEVRPTVGPSWQMDRGAEIRNGAPGLGEHNAYVFGDILGLSEEEQKRLAESGVAR